MTIAKIQFEGVGARMYLPEGPYGASGQFPFPSFAEGTVVAGDDEAEFVFLKFNVIAALTINQGDVLIWDNGYLAVQSATGSGAHPFGASVGTFFLGGRVGDPAAAPNAGNVWSYTFAPGVYGIWVQRAGTSLLNCATTNAQTKPINTTAVAGQVNAPSAALAGSMGLTGISPAPTSWAFTANTVSGSAVLTATAAAKGGLQKGQQLSGTGIATGATILDINGPLITMSLAATATNSAQTITATNSVALATTTNGSPVLTNVTTIAGLYPNQTIAGTGIPGSTTIVSIVQIGAGNYSITMSANATATANNIAITGSIYIEALLRWPQVTVQN